MLVPTIERTLVKSPPELWELVDDRGLMSRWAQALLGPAAAGAIRVVDRQPCERLVWETSGDGGATRLDLGLAEKGWGTNVSIEISSPGGDRGNGAGPVLERLLDELGSPQRRPFSRG